jgi:hypothetical protein
METIQKTHRSRSPRGRGLKRRALRDLVSRRGSCRQAILMGYRAWRLLLNGSQEIEQGHSSKIGIRLA